MLAHQVHLRVVPWDDSAFTHAVERVFRDIELSPLEVDCPRAAELAQHRIREQGWPTAIVRYWRTVDEVLCHEAHWTVYRDRPD